MNLISRCWTGTLLLLAMLSTMHCGGETVAEEKARRQMIKEQKAILAYSSEVSAVDAKQQAFVKTWKKVNQLQDVKAHQEAWKTKLIPAFKAYIKALETMPVGSESLKKIHTIVLKSYEEALTSFTAYPEGLTEKNFADRSKKILNALKSVTKADDEYNSKLREYYAANRVNLKAKK